MKKLLKVLVVNFVALIVVLYAIEVGIWLFENENLRLHKDSYRAKGILKFHQGVKVFNFIPRYFPNPNEGWGRAADGLKYTKKKPIVLFGCSYTYGFNLKPEQIFSYKLANLAHRPVYNRAMPAWGIQHMLYQSRLEEFYQQIPEPEYVIYIYMNDHIRRLYILTFMAGHMLNEDFNLRYKDKNGELCEIRNQNPVFKFIKRLYITNILHRFYVEHFILNEPNYYNCYDFAFKHFSEAKKEMQKHWKKTKYVVFFYDSEIDADYLKDKLVDDDFIVFDADDITDEDLTSSKYFTTDYHPTEAAWDLLTPLIMKKLNIK